MPLTYEITSPPSEEPVTMGEMREFARIDSGDDDALLFMMLQSSRQAVEQMTRRVLVATQVTLYLDQWQRRITLPHVPVQAVTSIEYLDTDEQLQTVPTTVYQTDLVSEPSRIMVRDGERWPDVAYRTYNAIRIHYTAGYADMARIPQAIKIAIQMLTADSYEHREARLDYGAGMPRVEDNPTVMRLLGLYTVTDI